MSAGDAADALRPIEDFRPYLKLIARAHLPQWARRHVDESDAVQETLLEAHRARDAFRGTTAGEQAAWLRRILASNLADAVRGLRRKKRDVARDLPIEDLVQRSSARLDEWLATESAGPARRVERVEESLRIVGAIERLPDGQREAVVLRHFQGVSIQDIAAELEVSRAAAAGLLRRGLEALRADLGRNP